MTTTEYMFIAMIGLVIVAFMIGQLWADAGYQLREEREEDEQIRVGSHPNGRRINIR